MEENFINLLPLSFVYIHFNQAHTHLSDDHFLVGSIDANKPLAHVENHGSQHPLPCLQTGKCTIKDYTAAVEGKSDAL